MMLLGGRTKLNRLFPQRLHNLGRWGPVCNLVAVFFVLQALVIYCFPATYPVSADNMNYGQSSFTLVISMPWPECAPRGTRKCKRLTSSGGVCSWIRRHFGGGVVWICQEAL